MPEEEYEWLPREDILSFDEIERLVRAFVAVGAPRFRLTGGEPLLRKDLTTLVRQIAGVGGVRDLALTTNGVRLPELAADLRTAGLRRVTVSIDSLRADRFRELTKRDVFDRAMAGIRAACDAGFESVKLNTVVVRGFNEDEIADLVAFGRELGVEPRFIEYMDVGGATQWRRGQVVSREEILAAVAAKFGKVEPVATPAAAPADRFVLEDGTKFGVIASTTAPFCSDCDRARVTADGTMLTCLYARIGVDLRGFMRRGADDAALREKLRRLWSVRRDRGAEERLALREERGILAPVEDLRDDPHLEMHTRGG